MQFVFVLCCGLFFTGYSFSLEAMDHAIMVGRQKKDLERQDLCLPREWILGALYWNLGFKQGVPSCQKALKYLRFSNQMRDKQPFFSTMNSILAQVDPSSTEAWSLLLELIQNCTLEQWQAEIKDLFQVECPLETLEEAFHSLLAMRFFPDQGFFLERGLVSEGRDIHCVEELFGYLNQEAYIDCVANLVTCLKGSFSPLSQKQVGVEVAEQIYLKRLDLKSWMHTPASALKCRIYFKTYQHAQKLEALCMDSIQNESSFLKRKKVFLFRAYHDMAQECEALGLEQGLGSILDFLQEQSLVHWVMLDKSSQVVELCRLFTKHFQKSFKALYINFIKKIPSLEDQEALLPMVSIASPDSSEENSRL